MLSAVGKLVDRLRQAVRADAVAGLRDAELVERFRRNRDEAAFAALVERHGPLVFGLCQRVLQNTHDAEDAYQATFLVLARRAASIHKPASLAAWLYGVAFRLAMKMRMRASNRHRRERDTPAAKGSEPTDPLLRELQEALDEELQRLPEKQRLPLLLCYLDGLSQEEAAAQLGWSRGTLKRRLERGRAVLRARLTRRGLTLAAGFVASLSGADVLAISAPATATAPLPKAAALFATGGDLSGILSQHVVTLAQGALRAMLTAKIKILVVLLVLMGTSFGAAALSRQYIAQAGVAARAPGLQGSELPGNPTLVSDTKPQDRSGPPSKAEQEFESLKKEYEKALKDNPRDAKDQYLPRFNALAEKYIKQAVSFDILAYALQESSGPYSSKDSHESLKLLTNHHATDERMKDLIAAFYPWGEASAQLLRAVMEKHGDKLTRARACRLLLRLRQREIGDADHYLASPAIQQNLVRKTINGAAYYERIVANLDTYRKEADELTKVLKDKYAGMLPELVWGKPIPDSVLTDLQGNVHRLSEFKGKIVVVNIFATDKPGVLDILLRDQPRHARRYKDKPVVVFNVGLDETKDTFLDFLKKNPTPVSNCWVGPHSEFALDWSEPQRRNDNPNCLLFDIDGNYRFNSVEGNTLQDVLDELFTVLYATGKLGKATKATEAFVELRDKFDKEVTDDIQKQGNARTAEEIQAMLPTSARATFPPRFNDLAEKYADDPASFHILLYNLMICSRGLVDNHKQMGRAFTLLAKNHLHHPEMRFFLEGLPRMVGNGAWEERRRLATEVFEKNSDLAAQGYACRMLIQACKQDLDEARYYVDHPEHHEALEKRYPNGREYYKKLIGDMDKIEKRITEFEDMLKDKYAGLLEDGPK